MRLFLPATFAFLILCSTGCLKSGNDNGCQAVAPETEAPRMMAYCDSAGINYTRLSNGLFYQVIDAGSGIAPTLDSKISISYKGMLLNGTVFDNQPTPVDYFLKNLIDGWKSGLPLIKKGGRIKLVIPSYLGYGCTGAGPIAPNSILYFDITLADVQ
jgi:FKBP-type peptidyl-prolyl cis-trans isomerase FkpA